MRSFILAGSILACFLATVASSQTMSTAYPGTFVDISTTGGTAITGVGDDSLHSITTTVGNVLFPAGPVTICNNGWAMASPTAPFPYGVYFESDIPLPTGMPTGFSSPGITDAGSGLLLAWWDDLYPNPCCSSSTTIYWQETGGILYIMWKNSNHYSDSTPSAGITFEIQVFGFPGSGPWIQYLYSDTTFTGSTYGTLNDNAASATIGYVKDGNASGGNLRWSYDTAGSVTSGSVLSIFPPLGLFGVARATPTPVLQGSTTLLTVAMSDTATQGPPSSAAVTIDLSLVGGSSTQGMYDDGVNGGDVTSGDNLFSFAHAVPVFVPPGTYSLPWSAIDGAAQTTSGVLSLTVNAIPPVNDGCATPIVLSYGPNGPFSNAGATSGPLTPCGSGGYNDVWFSYTAPCSGTVSMSTACGSNTILSAYGTCGGPSLACSYTSPTCGFGGATISFPATIATTYLVQAASYYSGTPVTFSINVTQGGVFALAFSEPGGPGSGNIQIDVTNGPTSGLYFLAATLNQGAFPSGWLYGVDIPFAELSALITTGFPFLGPLGPCGDMSLSFSGAGVLTGIPIYAVALGISQPGPLFPSVFTTPVTFTLQ